MKSNPGWTNTYQIKSPYFVAGVIISNHIVIKAAPIIKYTKGMTLHKLKQYCEKKGWKCEQSE